ncbi:type VI secretion system tip protein VgrG [Glaciimonas sp. PAMC28666]|uniref:type VI secretion system tip protein VgrG n=1 Tax=Glaciimonas sp. PAMC28666 TaxID=2807626 RepID=UPI0019622B45|nr:type VI secretion system tip protein VgrG [Glaciimonas sp. PAMC28666]QRX82519.1 type VI secretion system tip protein VgrG [Glaciimonas sp. PAMC28666]
MPISPLNDQGDLVSFTILINGDRMPDIYDVSQVRVQKQINRIPSAKITLLDGSSSDETFAISETASFAPGTEIEIMAGYHGTDASIFKGIVVKHAIKIRSGGKSSLVISCYDKALKLTQGRKSAYLGKSDSAIFQTLIADAGLSADVSSTTDQHDAVVRYYATDWDFLVSRAEINGHIVIVEDGKVKVGPPELDGEAELLIGYGNALAEIDAEIDACTQLTSVKCSAWDFTQQALAEGTSTEPTVNAQGNLSGKTLSGVLDLPAYALQSCVPLTAEQLAVWANAQLLKSRLARLRGTVTFCGNATPRPGQMVQLAGLGARFNGSAFVASVTQTIEGGDWSTEVGFGMDNAWFIDQVDDIAPPPAAGLSSGVRGLQIAKVKQIDQDPDGQNRILVDVPMIGVDGDGIWARLASGYATKNGGIFFVPEMGDEVILGFLNDDPSYPIVLGSLYSSQHTPPYPGDAPNTNKAIVTNSQLKISMDDVKKILRIETPGGHIITLNDDDTTLTIVDSNKNKLSFTSDGVTLDSPGDISIKASGAVNIQSGTGISVKAGADLDMQGMNVKTKATMALSGQGQASAEITSSGQVTVRGAMVMIN